MDGWRFGTIVVNRIDLGICNDWRLKNMRLGGVCIIYYIAHYCFSLLLIHVSFYSLHFVTLMIHDHVVSNSSGHLFLLNKIKQRRSI